MLRQQRALQPLVERRYRGSMGFNEVVVDAAAWVRARAFKSAPRVRPECMQSAYTECVQLAYLYFGTPACSRTAYLYYGITTSLGAQPTAHDRSSFRPHRRTARAAERGAG